MMMLSITTGGLYMKTERITVKQGKHYYIKAKFEIEDALDKLGRLEDEEDAKRTTDSNNTKRYK